MAAGAGQSEPVVDGIATYGGVILTHDSRAGFLDCVNRDNNCVLCVFVCVYICMCVSVSE